MLVAFILICIAVILLSVPVPGPWGHWIACLLAIIALILACVGTRITLATYECDPPEADAVLADGRLPQR